MPNVVIRTEEHELHDMDAVHQAFLPHHVGDGSQDYTTNSASMTSFPDKQPSKSQSSFLHDHWLHEILGLTLSVVAIVAIIIVLKRFDGQPLPDWPEGITLNALISVLSTISKATMIAVIASCISQLKWLWFQRPRSLKDFDCFDDASRGPWGAIHMLSSPMVLDLAGLGALITVVALLVDPLTQQILSFSTAEIPSDLATVSRAQMYDGGRSADECELDSLTCL